MASPANKKSSGKKTHSKADLKKKIKALKGERQKGQEVGDDKSVSILRRRIHLLKRQTRKMAADVVAETPKPEEAVTDATAETPKPEEAATDATAETPKPEEAATGESA